MGRGSASVAVQGQPWFWAGGGRVSGHTSEDSSILALGSTLPGPGKGVGPGPSLLWGYFGQTPGAQPRLCTTHSPASAYAESTGPLKPFQMSARTLGWVGGSWSQMDTIFPHVCARWCHVAWQPSLWAAAQAWPRPGGHVRALWPGSGAAAGAVGKHDPLSISSAQIVSLLAPCASKSVVCLSLEDTLPSASK